MAQTLAPVFIYALSRQFWHVYLTPEQDKIAMLKHCGLRGSICGAWAQKLLGGTNKLAFRSISVYNSISELI